MNDKNIKEQILQILNELDRAETPLNIETSVTDKVIKLFDAQNQHDPKTSEPKAIASVIVFRRISFGLAAMIFSVFIIVVGFLFLPKTDQGPFITAAVVVLLLGAWQIDKGNKENLKRIADKN